MIHATTTVVVNRADLLEGAVTFRSLVLSGAQLHVIVFGGSVEILCSGTDALSELVGQLVKYAAEVQAADPAPPRDVIIHWHLQRADRSAEQ